MDRNEVFSRIVSAYEAGELVPMCAWCGRVRIDGTWLAPPAAALDAIDRRNTLSHSICDECASDHAEEKMHPRVPGMPDSMPPAKGSETVQHE